MNILDLPSELLTAILSLLPPSDLAHIAQTCQTLFDHAASPEADSLWRRKVQAQTPFPVPNPLASPYPCATFRALYASLDPLWFLARQGIWFSDTGFGGKLLVVRFDPRRGCIEAYNVAATRQAASMARYTWEGEGGPVEVAVSPVIPTVRLDLDMPLFQFDASESTNVVDAMRSAEAARLIDVPLPPPRPATKFKIGNERAVSTFYINFVQLSRAVPSSPDPASQPTWPPSMIPSPRVASFPEGLRRPYAISEHDVPDTRDDICVHGFRIGRQRVDQMPRSMIYYSREDGRVERLVNGPNMPATWYVTYATLERELYTPTMEHPWRGVWVGDYGAHGCEFLLLHQPAQKSVATDHVIAKEWERDATWEWRRKDPVVYKSDLVAVKLTGDPNIPRGECTFVVSDLNDGATVAGKAPLGEEGEHVCVVRSKGHAAHHGFSDDTWALGWLFLLSPDRIAYYWVETNCITFFQRVDMASLVHP